MDENMNIIIRYWDLRKSQMDILEVNKTILVIWATWEAN